MATTGLRGSFPLTADSIKQEIKRTMPGTYVLGNLNEGRFQSLYVGRSDTDVAKQLMTHLRQSTRFKFETYLEPQQAFDKECELFHFLRPKGNKIHPQAPKNRDWKCPECGK